MSDVVVIGAGLAGLAAARRLVAGGHEVTVVEARERVGGRTEGLVLEDGTPLELGGQWVGEGHTRMHELIGELGLSTFRTWNDEGQLLLRPAGQAVHVKPHKGAVPRLSPFALADLLQGMLRFGRLAARTDLERPWLTPGAEVLDGQTWESWIRRNLRTRAGRAYFHVACEAVFAAQASDVSLLHALFYAHSNADLETLLAVDRGGQQDRVTGGSVLVAEAMAAALGERVVLGRPVRRIEHDGNGVRVIARDGTQYRGDAAIVTLPPALAGRLEYDPPLPSWRDQLTQRMPAGSVIKAYAIYPEPFWRSARAQRAGRLGHRAGEGDVRQLPAVRHPRRPDGLPGGQGGTHLGPAQPGRAAGGRDRLLRPLLRPAGGTAPAVRGAGLDGRGIHPRLLRRPLRPGHLDVVRARRGARRPGASTGPAPSARRGGTATWKAPSAAAKPPPTRWPRSDSGPVPAGYWRLCLS